MNKVKNELKNQWAWSANALRGATTTFLGQNNFKNEFNTIKLLRMQIFSKIWKLLKITHKGGGDFLNLGGKKCPPGGELFFLVHSTNAKSLCNGI